MHVDLGEVSVHYDSFGEGRPFLALHGSSLDRRAAIFEFEPCLSARAGWRRIYPDLPGHGDTAGAEAVATNDGLVDVLVEFLDAVCPGERVVIAGTSYGGYLVRGLVDRIDDRLDGVCLNVAAPVLGRPLRTPPRRVIAGADAIRVRSRDAGWSWYENLAVADSAALRQYGAVLKDTTADADFIARLREPSAVLSVEREPSGEVCQAPSLILAGRQDNICGYQDVWELLESFSRATFAVLDRAGHLLRGEQPILFSVLVSEWLDRVEEWTRLGRPTAVAALS